MPPRTSTSGSPRCKPRPTGWLTWQRRPPRSAPGPSPTSRPSRSLLVALNECARHATAGAVSPQKLAASQAAAEVGRVRHAATALLRETSDPAIGRQIGELSNEVASLEAAIRGPAGNPGRRLRDRPLRSEDRAVRWRRSGHSTPSQWRPAGLRPRELYLRERRRLEELRALAAQRPDALAANAGRPGPHRRVAGHGSTGLRPADSNPREMAMARVSLRQSAQPRWPVAVRHRAVATASTVLLLRPDVRCPIPSVRSAPAPATGPEVGSRRARGAGEKGTSIYRHHPFERAIPVLRLDGRKAAGRIARGEAAGKTPAAGPGRGNKTAVSVGNRCFSDDTPTLAELGVSWKESAEAVGRDSTGTWPGRVLNTTPAAGTLCWASGGAGFHFSGRSWPLTENSAARNPGVTPAASPLSRHK